MYWNKASQWPHTKHCVTHIANNSFRCTVPGFCFIRDGYFCCFKNNIYCFVCLLALIKEAHSTWTYSHSIYQRLFLTGRTGHIELVLLILLVVHVWLFYTIFIVSGFGFKRNVYLCCLKKLMDLYQLAPSWYDLKCVESDV